MATTPAVIVLTGASGAGKTTLALGLEEQRRAGVACVNVDQQSRRMAADGGAMPIERLVGDLRADPRVEVAVLDTQIRPTEAQQMLARVGVAVARVVLVDCDHQVRHARLRESRGQAELATPEMDCWAAYLRGQADALQIPIIDTGSLSVADAVVRLGDLVTEVLREVRGDGGVLAAALMDEADRARRQDRPLDAHGAYTEALALCRHPAAAPADLVRAVRGLGQLERDLGRPEAALPLYDEAVALCRRQRDPLRLAHTIRHLGDLHLVAGRLMLAEPCYREAVGLYRADEHTSPLHLANALRPLALLEERLGRTAAAIALWQEARALYTAVKVVEGAAESAAHLARLGSVT